MNRQALPRSFGDHIVGTFDCVYRDKAEHRIALPPA
jgi:hypothetical protein